MNDDENMYKLTASIVVYNNSEQILWHAIKSFLLTELQVHILLIDNSPTDRLKFISERDKRISYLHNGKNIGFGAAHNIAIKKVITKTKYHLILNPDVYFHGDVLERMFLYMEEHKDVGILSPKVLYPDGNLQYLCRKLATPADIFLKRLTPAFLRPVFKKRLDEYEFRDQDYSRIMQVPSLSGCFMFVRYNVFEKIGYFDENIFMYMEDFDLTRRVSRFYKTVYYPEAVIYHHYARESASNKKLLYIAIKSTIYYFNKWGWFFDSERKRLNRAARNVNR